MINVQRLTTTLTWHKPPGGICLAHHYTDAPELGEVYTPEVLAGPHKAAMTRLVKDVQRHAPKHGYTIGSTTITGKPELQWFMVTLNYLGIKLHAVYRYDLGKGKNVVKGFDLALPEQKHATFQAWAKRFHDDCHAALDLPALWNEPKP